MRKLSCVILSAYLVIQLLLQPTQATNDTVTAKCPSSQFTCKNEKCIPQSWYCDSDDDCDDGSDESDCRVVTCAQDHFQCATGKCIPQRWHCDHENDCDDGSDELAENCNEKTCKADQFACKTGACIPEGWKCDGQNDCTDGDDELKEQCDVTTCAVGDFQCANGRCISERWKCDQDNDCGDNSDEHKDNCPEQKCDEEEFQCANMICIKSSWQCDGDFDCNDNSDEQNCNSTESHSKCSSSEFTCQDSKECIHVSWKCDGEHDCEDGSDEKSDCHITCRPDQFMCEKDSYCIHKVLKCDGNEDCLDGSDERNCSIPLGCGKDEFDCLGDGKKCIPLSKVCDKSNDCGNFEDESSELECSKNPCDHQNGGCSQICVNLYGNKHRCECKERYEFAPGSTTMCQDINECEIPGWCSQECTNYKGGFKCSCMEGYSLVQHRYCRADGESAQLLLANRNDLRRISIENHKKTEYTLLVEDEKVECAISVGYDITNNKVYWSDVKLEQILSADMSDKSNVVPVVNKMVNTPDGIAVDWIHGNLYWTDSGYDTIEVSTLDGKYRRLLIDSDLDEPRSIVVDPHNAYMYWTDWGRTPKIEKCGMDGTDRKTIIQNDIMWPNGITIDYVDNRLYWVDAKLHIIASADLDGGSRRTVHASEVAVRHPFGITVFEDTLYWTDWRSESIHKINKFGKGNVTSVVIDLNEPMDVHILHKYRQPKYDNLCGTNNGGCEQFCLPSPKGLTGPRHTCACKDTFELNDDKKTCTKLVNTTEDTLRTPPANHTKTGSPNKTKHRMWNLKYVDEEHEKKHSESVPASTTPEATTGDELVVSTEDHTGYNIATTTDNSTNVKMPVNKQPEENVGQVAIIAIAVIVGIAIIASIVIFVIFRRVKRKNMKSMNFDNPVYRKTTEESVSLEKDAKNPSLQPLNPPTNELV